MIDKTKHIPIGKSEELPLILLFGFSKIILNRQRCNNMGIYRQNKRSICKHNPYLLQKINDEFGIKLFYCWRYPGEYFDILFMLLKSFRTHSCVISFLKNTLMRNGVQYYDIICCQLYQFSSKKVVITSLEANSIV